MSHLVALVLAVDEHEPSKTPFYVAGGLFAVWAVVVSVVGMRAPDFPRGTGAQRGVVALSLLLMLGAVSTAVITS